MTDTTEVTQADLCDQLGGYQAVFNAIGDAVKTWPEPGGNLSISVSAFIDSITHRLAHAPPVVAGQFSIQEREDDMLIGESHWQFGWVCIARRPKLLSNDQWRATANRIVAALTAIRSPSSGEADGGVG